MKIINPALILMSKAPVPGLTKTRLQQRFSPKQCADIHIACLKDLNANLQDAYFSRYLFFTGDKDKFPMEIRRNFIFHPQRGVDLGEKIANAFKYAFKKHNPVVVIGSDCPVIATGTVDLALAILAAKDLVLGPSNDGGYYLMGLNKFRPELFQDVTWGSASVLKETLDIAGRLSLRHGLLPKEVDLDTPEDVDHFLKKPPARNTYTGSILSQLMLKIPVDKGNVF